MKPTKIASWALRLVTAALFVMAAFPKLTAQAEPVELFSQLGGAGAMYLTGVLELVGAALLLVPRTKVYGALLAMVVMAGAIVSHLAVLGFDGMFPLAVVLFVLSGVLIAIHLDELPVVGRGLADEPGGQEPVAG